MASLSAEEAVAQLFSFGRDPHAKRNGTGWDYVSKVRTDTYEFINPRQFNLRGRSVFITGASKGIGRVAAARFAIAGASQIGIGARSDLTAAEVEIMEAAKSAGHAPPQVLRVKLDVTNKESVAQAVAEMEKHFGRLDILINNGGYLEKAVLMTEIDPDEWWHTMQVNVLGIFLTTTAFLPLLKSTPNGLRTILNVSSTYAFTKFCTNSAYQISKLATLRLTDLINNENSSISLAATAPEHDNDILCQTMHPGGVNTDLARGLPEYAHPFLTDTAELGADTIVWMTAERREWLRGRYVSAAWDLEEVCAKKDKIVKEDQLRLRLAVGLD